MSVPQNIQELANKVRNEIYGRDVRESIAKSMEATGEVAEWSRQVAQDIVDGKFDEGELATEIERKLNDLETQYAPQLTSVRSEVENARGNEPNLGDRLNSVDSQLAQIAIQVDSGLEEDVQNAFDYLGDTPKRVMILGGSYEISLGLELPSNIEVVCSEGVEFIAKEGMHEFNIITNKDKIIGNKNIKWFGGKVNGNVIEGVDQKVAGFFLYNVKQSIFKGVEVVNCSRNNSMGHHFCNSAVWLGSCENTIFVDAEIHHNEKVGFQVSGDIIDNPFGHIGHNAIITSKLYENGNSGVDFSGGENHSKVERCIAYDNARLEGSNQVSINSAHCDVIETLAYMTKQYVVGHYFNFGHGFDTWGLGPQAPHGRLIDCKGLGGSLGLKIESSDFVDVENLIIEDGEIVIKDSDYFDISNLTTTKTTGLRQIHIRESNHGRISDGLFVEAENDCITFRGASQNTVTDCRFINPHTIQNERSKRIISFTRVDGLISDGNSITNNKFFVDSNISNSIEGIQLPNPISEGVESSQFVNGNEFHGIDVPITPLSPPNNYKGINLIEGKSVVKEDLFINRSGDNYKVSVDVE